jgi:ATP-dependent HslUV protease subunit HslV
VTQSYYERCEAAGFWSHLTVDRWSPLLMTSLLKRLSGITFNAGILATAQRTQTACQENLSSCTVAALAARTRVTEANSAPSRRAAPCVSPQGAHRGILSRMRRFSWQAFDHLARAPATIDRRRALLGAALPIESFRSRSRSIFTAAAPNDNQVWHHTTILAVRKNDQVCLIGDGQVSMGETILKANARKVRRLGNSVIAGFSGATADALTLFERLEQKLEAYPDQLLRASVELAKDWRQDKALRRLDALLLVADRSITLTLTGTGDVLEPSDGVMAIGSGGMYALAAARALLELDSWTAEQIARRAMHIASEICVFTNEQLTCEVLSAS